MPYNIMKAEELRIGNYVKYNGAWAKVYSIIGPYPESEYVKIELECNGLINAKLSDIEGIELTRNIVQYFGFIQRLEGLYVKGHYFVSDVLCWSFGLEYNGRKLVDIKYLHELQNVYYSLTKKELRKENEKWNHLT